LTPREIAPEVCLLTLGGFVNIYLVGNARGWVLIDTGIIAADDLARLGDPAWCSRQEDLWWTQVI